MDAGVAAEAADGALSEGSLYLILFVACTAIGYALFKLWQELRVEDVPRPPKGDYVLLLSVPTAEAELTATLQAGLSGVDSVGLCQACRWYWYGRRGELSPAIQQLFEGAAPPPEEARLRLLRVEVGADDPRLHCELLGLEQRDAIEELRDSGAACALSAPLSEAPPRS